MELLRYLSAWRRDWHPAVACFAYLGTYIKSKTPVLGFTALAACPLLRHQKDTFVKGCDMIRSCGGGRREIGEGC